MEKRLPIGSVVLLQGATKKTVIIGIMQTREKEPSKVYDYLGVPYPEGYIGNGSTYVFDHEHIQDIIFEGFHDSERERFMKAAERMYMEIENALEGSKPGEIE